MIPQAVLTEEIGHIALSAEHFGVDMQWLNGEGALKGHLIERRLYWLALEGQVDQGLIHREVMDDDIPGGGFVWIIADKPEELFEVHPILAIDFQPHGDPRDRDLVEDDLPSDERPQPDFGGGLFDVDRRFERGLATLRNADPARRRREGQQIERDVLNDQPGMHAGIVLSDAYTDAQRHQPVLGHIQDGGRCHDDRDEDEKRGDRPHQESHRSAYPHKTAILPTAFRLCDAVPGPYRVSGPLPAHRSGDPHDPQGGTR